jgi:site-specific DNA-methyltransferase (adenine-specific)
VFIETADGWECGVELKVNKIYCENHLALMDRMPPECIDLVVTSPPYGTLREYKGFSFDYQACAAGLWKVIKPGGVVVWIVGDQVIKGSESGESFRQALYFMGIGFRLHDTMVYMKKGFSFPDQTRYNQVFEYMLVLSKGRPKTINLLTDKRNNWAGDYIARQKGDRQKDGSITPNTAFKSGKLNKVVKESGVRDNIWIYGTGAGNSTNDKEAMGHPAIFPEKLAADHIRSWSNPGGLVFDPMCGSGTTLKAAVSLNRDYLGCDISEEYCEIARARLDRLLIKREERELI